MQTITMKRALSFLLAFALAFSMLPIPAFASETEISEQSLEADAAEVTETVTEDEVTKTTETTVNTTEPTTAPQPVASYSDTMNQVQAAMDGILNDYLGTAELTAEETAAMVAGLTPYDAAAAEGEIYDLEHAEAFLQLTEEEIQKLIDDNATFCAFGDAVSYKASTEGAISVYTTVEVLDGQVSVADTANSNTVSSGTVTIKASGSLLSKKTNTITITNESGSKATLKFDYSASTYNSFTIAGTAASASGTYTITLDNEGTLTLVLQSNSGVSNRTATLTLSNFSLVPVADSADVTFSHNNLGSITIGGAAVTSGSTVTIESAGAAAVATPVSGATFLGWLSTTDNKLLSTSASATLVPTADLTSVEAVFVNSSSAPFFRVNTDYMFDNLPDAVTCAENQAKKIVILANNGTLPTADYTITSGVTLLIPFDAADTLYTNAPAHDNHATWVQPTAFRTLTMAQNATITVESGAAISLSAKHHAGATGGPASKANAGSPTGAVSFIKMNTGSKITVQGGGNLYAWGYITGSGSVEVQNSGTVYENFQLNDFRGGSHTSWASDANKVKKVFPINSYYVQNIEVPMTLYSGASEICYSSIYASYAASTSAVFIASSGAMFNLTDGYLTKKYDGTTDRLILDFYGTGSLSPLSLSLGGTSINSGNYTMPINSNITVNIHSGKVSIDQSIALLPGAVVAIDNSAEVSVAKGKNIYVYDSDQWLAKYLYPSTARFHPLAYAPGRTYNRTDADLKDAAVLVNGTLTATEGAIYTTSPGYANIYSTGTGVVNLIAGTETNTYQVTKLASNMGFTAGTTEAIPITSAQLKNADGSYQQTTGSAGTYHYDSTTGRWYRNLEIVATNIAVGSGLDLHFYVNSADMMEGATYTAVVTKKFADGRADSVKKISSVATSIDGTFGPWADEPIEDSNGNVTATYKEFVFEDISAKEMTDPVEVKIYLNDKDGKPTTLQVNTTYTETVQNYAIRTFADIADKTTDDIPLLRTALADMLYYGAAAQQYFNYNNTDATLATTSSADNFQTYLNYKTANAQEIASYLNVTEANPEEKLFVGNTVSATNTLMFTFYFGLPKREGYSAIITYIDHNGNAKEKGIDGPDFYERTEGSLYGVDVLGMSIVDGRSKITCKLYACDLETAEAGGVDPIVTVVDSVEGYARRMNSNAIFVEMMEFVDSASKYFDYKNNPTSTS